MSKSVECFERKQSCNNGGSNPGLGDGESTPSSVWDLQESKVPLTYQRDMLFHQAAGFGNRNSPMDFA
jgi:hypothetical protein